jgi:hypothetical protein
VFEEAIRNNDKKTAVVVPSDNYVPYDIRCTLFEVAVTASTIFPKLNADVVKAYLSDWDIISFATMSSYVDFFTISQTYDFIKNTVFSKSIIKEYCKKALDKLKDDCTVALSYLDWIHIAKKKSSIEYYAAIVDIALDTTFIDEWFNSFIVNGYGRLSSEVSRRCPPIVTKTISVIIADRNPKSALIVMDGMSLFDFKAISYHFGDIQFDYGCSYALIPTTTPISRQSLLPRLYVRTFTIFRKNIYY